MLGDEDEARGEETGDEEADASADGAGWRGEEVGDLDGGEVVLVDGGDECAVFWEDPLGPGDEELGEVAWNSSSEIGCCLNICYWPLCVFGFDIMLHKAPFCAVLHG